MTYLLDTNTCIRYLNRRAPAIRRRLHEKTPADIAICSVIKAELYFGARKSQCPSDSLARQREFVEQFISFPFDDSSADIYGRLRADLESKGTPIGPNDLLIASIALENDCILVTANLREFKRVEGLVCENWEE